VIRIEPVGEGVFEKQCDERLKSAQARCAYSEWRRARKGLSNICVAHGSYYNVMNDSGDYRIPDDWFGLRELCVKETRTGFVTCSLLSSIGLYVMNLPRSYVLLVSPDSVFAPVSYSILLTGDCVCATVDGCNSPEETERVLRNLPWFVSAG